MEKNILIRQCDMLTNIRVSYLKGSLVVENNKIITSNYSIIEIESEEDEEYYRSIEDGGIEKEKILVYQKREK